MRFLYCHTSYFSLQVHLRATLTAYLFTRCCHTVRFVFCFFFVLMSYPSIPVAAQSKAWACSRSLAGIVGSNPTGGMDVCPL